MDRYLKKSIAVFSGWRQDSTVIFSRETVVTTLRTILVSWGRHLLLVLYIWPVLAVASEEVRIIKPQSQEDASHHYFSQLLQMALNKNVSGYSHAEVRHTPFVLEQGRAEQALKAGQHIDVYWMGTSLKRENELIAIRIPLLKGLLGYRGLIIRENERGFYKARVNWLRLNHRSVCQGMHWPDSDILERGGFRVIRSARFKSMFAMLENYRCDMFPRGIHEGPAETVAYQWQSEALGWFDQYLIYYPFPMYFFTSKETPLLAQRIKEGLELMIDDDSFTRYMENHPVTQHLFPLSQWADRVEVKLLNPELPVDTDITDTRYWIVPQ